jgi:putative sporulation protein YyaC
MFFNGINRTKYINIEDSGAASKFSSAFENVLSASMKEYHKNIVFVCIGTDRSTGDSFGPLIGYKLNSLRYSNVHVFGTLDTPVHAKNLDEVLEEIRLKINKPFIIAVDACLGKMESVGYVTVGSGPIKPGSGVKKELTPVGDMNITGIVNFGGFMDFLVLQNTRLSLVMKMADIVTGGIKSVLFKMSESTLKSFEAPNIDAADLM